ncbi:MAG TPA: SRPBCC domain-containing protein [Dongiaceae bacterium]|nr:SRPBCC domain-containing protein [Dongiaceae bacterium]
MSTAPSPMSETAQHELVITRTFDAPRALVFRAWSAPEHMARWLGANKFTTLSYKMDFRPGGAYRACVTGMDGKQYWMRGIYREIVEPERLVFTFSWEMEGERGRENVITITFGELGEKTKMTFRQAFFETVENRDAHLKGWGECLDRLAEYVAKER